MLTTQANLLRWFHPRGAPPPRRRLGCRVAAMGLQDKLVGDWNVVPMPCPGTKSLLSPHNAAKPWRISRPPFGPGLHSPYFDLHQGTLRYREQLLTTVPADTPDSNILTWQNDALQVSLQPVAGGEAFVIKEKLRNRDDGGMWHALIPCNDQTPHASWAGGWRFLTTNAPYDFGRLDLLVEGQLPSEATNVEGIYQVIAEGSIDMYVLFTLPQQKGQPPSRGGMMLKGTLHTDDADPNLLQMTFSRKYVRPLYKVDNNSTWTHFFGNDADRFGWITAKLPQPHKSTNRQLYVGKNFRVTGGGKQGSFLLQQVKNLSFAEHALLNPLAYDDRLFGATVSAWTRPGVYKKGYNYFD